MERSLGGKYPADQLRCFCTPTASCQSLLGSRNSGLRRLWIDRNFSGSNCFDWYERRDSNWLCGQDCKRCRSENCRRRRDSCQRSEYHARLLQGAGDDCRCDQRWLVPYWRHWYSGWQVFEDHRPQERDVQNLRRKVHCSAGDGK